MKTKAFAKINLSIDVGRVQPDGMHPVDMLMQGIDLCDAVSVELVGRGTGIELSCNNPELPAGRGNLAYRAAELMLEAFGDSVVRGEGTKAPWGDCQPGKPSIRIHIEKSIPMAAGLAGGSSDGAAVMLLLAELWGLDVSLEELCKVGAKLGSDVPFTLMVNAAASELSLSKGGSLGTCARARGTGTELTAAKPLDSWVVLSKPPIEVSTKEVYQGIDNCHIPERPDNDQLQSALEKGDKKAVAEQMINVLENYTLSAKPETAELKARFREAATDAIKVLMSGSGPTVFALFDKEGSAEQAAEKLKDLGYDAFCCHTLV